MKSIFDVITDIDKRMSNYLQYDRKKAYGIVSRHLSHDGTVVNLADNSLHSSEGEFAYFDDRYDIIWFHRINGVDFPSTSGEARAFKIKERISVILVFWAKRKHIYLGQECICTQSELYSKIAEYIAYKLDVTLVNCDFDMPEIIETEFLKIPLGKESILLKYQYEIIGGMAPPCLDCVPNKHC